MIQNPPQLTAQWEQSGTLKSPSLLRLIQIVARWGTTKRIITREKSYRQTCKSQHILHVSPYEGLLSAVYEN